MFNIKEYLDRPFSDQKVKIKHKDEEYLVRRLDGLELIKWYEIDPEKKADRIIYLLATCLLDGTTKKPIGNNLAEKFIRHYYDVAYEVAIKIREMSETLASAENKEVAEEQKNSTPTDIPSSTGNTVNVSDSIPPQPAPSVPTS